MYPPIVCYSCNNALGDKYWDYMNILLERQKIQSVNVIPGPPGGLAPHATGAPGGLASNAIGVNMYYACPVNISMQDVLDAFHITKNCCRQHMITNVKFDDFMNGGAALKYETTKP